MSNKLKLCEKKKTIGTYSTSDSITVRSVEALSEQLVLPFEQKKDGLTAAQIVEQMGPFRLAVTVAYQLKIDKDAAIEHGSTLQRRVLKNALGQRWKKKGWAPFVGVVVIEQADITKKVGESPLAALHPLSLPPDTVTFHLHILIKDHPELPADDNAALKIMQDAYEKGRTSLYVTRRQKKLHLLGKSGVLVQLVTDQTAACEYCTKAASDWRWKWDEWICFLSGDGITRLAQPAEQERDLGWAWKDDRRRGKPSKREAHVGTAGLDRITQARKHKSR